MVSSASLAFMALTLVICFAFPLGLALYVCIKKKAWWISVLIGALVFLVSQLILRIPLLQVIATMPWYQAMAQNLWLIGLFLSFTAGLFEETGRWLAFKYLLKNRLTTENAIAKGIGHGGFEAIALVGLTMISNLVISLQINSGLYDTALAPALGDQAALVKSQLVDTPATLFALGGVERIGAILFHTAASLLVYYAVKYKKPIFYVFALLAHTLLNLGAVVMNGSGIDPWLVEGYVLIWAAASVLLILNSKKVEARLAGPVGEALDIVPMEE